MILQLGANGRDVERLQQKLRELGCYRGVLDGVFGGGTESAVKIFQRSQNLVVDGCVGPLTQKALFGSIFIDNLQSEISLERRCLELTGSFETGLKVPECFSSISGDFDRQGISFGALQWNLGQGSLQPLLSQMISNHRDVTQEIFQDLFKELEGILQGSLRVQLEFANKIQCPRRHTIYEPWRGMFKVLGRTSEFQNIQLLSTQNLYIDALNMCRKYEVFTERAVALMFDIRVQNGSISKKTRQTILTEYEHLRGCTEDAHLRCIANLRADASCPKWKEDVRVRKMCIASGEGSVHGILYNLEKMFDVKLVPAKIFST